MEKIKKVATYSEENEQPLSGIKTKLEEVRGDLLKAQQILTKDGMNAQHIEKVKKCTAEVIKWNEVEQQVPRQRDKIDQLKLGDGNNTYFHASLRSKQKHNIMKNMHIGDVTLVITHEDLEKQVLEFYSNLMEKAKNNVQGINITAMRNVTQLNNMQRKLLVKRVDEMEILAPLKGIGELKVPTLDGYGATFFKSIYYFNFFLKQEEKLEKIKKKEHKRGEIREEVRDKNKIGRDNSSKNKKKKKKKHKREEMRYTCAEDKKKMRHCQERFVKTETEILSVKKKKLFIIIRLRQNMFSFEFNVS